MLSTFMSPPHQFLITTHINNTLYFSVCQINLKCLWGDGGANKILGQKVAGGYYIKWPGLHKKIKRTRMRPFYFVLKSKIIIS